MLAIWSCATSEAMRERPVKQSIRWLCSSSMRRRGMITGETWKLAAALELDPVEAAEGRRDLVLRADVFLDQVLLDVDRVARQVVLGDVAALHGRERVHAGRP